MVRMPLWEREVPPLLFSDIPRNVIMTWNADRVVSTFLERSGYPALRPSRFSEPASILTLTCRGRLILCQHGDRRISRRDPTEPCPAGGRLQGKKLNSPNDLVFDNQGNLYSPIRPSASRAV